MGSSVGKFYSCQNSNIDTITNINTIVNCVENGSLKDIISGSASPSLQFIFDFKSDTAYDNVRLTKGFMKLFVSNSLEMQKDNSYDNLKAKFREIETTSRDEVDSEDEIFAVNYEYYIYKYIIKSLIDYKISPHFVKFLGGVLDIPFTNITKFLSDKSGVDYIKTINNFKINLDYTLSGSAFGKYKLGENLRIPYVPILNLKLNDFQYGFILMEGINYNPDVKNFKIDESCSLHEYLHTYGKTSKNEVYKLLFQIVTALYALSLTKTIHNDLHAGNIYVTKRKPYINQYIIDDNIYNLSLENSAVIYDFDRSYHVGYVNDLLDELNYYSQSNEFIEMKDLVKIVTYFYANGDDIVKEGLLDVILKYKNNKSDRDFWKKIFDNGQYLQKPTTYDMEPLNKSEYASIDNYINVIKRLYYLISNPNSLSNSAVNKYTYYCNKNMFTDKGDIKIDYVYKNINLLKTNTGKDREQINILKDKIDLLNEDYEDLTYTTDNLRRENQGLKNKILMLQKEEGEISDSD